MFDIAWSEMVLIGAVALVVIGPKDLPKALRTVGQADRQDLGAWRRSSRASSTRRCARPSSPTSRSRSRMSAARCRARCNNDFKPIDPTKDFEPEAGRRCRIEAALKEAEAKLAELPLPEPLPPVEIAPEAPAREAQAAAPEAESLLPAAELRRSHAVPWPKGRSRQAAQAHAYLRRVSTRSSEAVEPRR